MSSTWIKMTKMVPEMPRVDSIDMGRMASLLWDMTASWRLLRAEYRRIYGSSGGAVVANPGRSLPYQYWSLYGFQLAYRF